MKVGMKLECGDLLVIMTAGEMAACETLARGVFQMAAHEVAREPAKTPAKVSRKDPKTQRKKGRKQAGPIRDKTCAVCGKKFRDKTRTNTRKFCSAKCIKAHEAGRGKAPATASEPPNPADPMLTDEQRKAARLEMIRRSAERAG